MTATSGWSSPPESVERFTRTEAMQPAGAALLTLAWQHREVLLNG